MRETLGLPGRRYHYRSRDFIDSSVAVNAAKWLALSTLSVSLTSLLARAPDPDSGSGLHGHSLVVFRHRDAGR